MVVLFTLFITTLFSRETHSITLKTWPYLGPNFTIGDSAKDGGPHFTQCMIGICPLVTHSYQNLQLQHKILTAATIDLGRRNFIVKFILS